MSEELNTFEVIKPFKYGGKLYERGEQWKPQGGLYDAQLISTEHYVLPVRDKEAERAKKVKEATARMKKIKAGTSRRKKHGS